MTMGSAILHMRAICKQFGEVSVLKDVDLSVYQGEVLALMGENGAGKSTLMKILCGIHSMTKGRVLIDGKEVFITSVKDAMQMGIALIHQELNLLDNLDIAGNIFLGREPRSKWGFPDKKKMNAETVRLLDRVGLEMSPQTKVDQLSLARQQLVEIAKALSVHSRILIMDEPTSSLTMKETALLFETIAELKAKGTTIIYISHRMEEIMRIADRVVVLKDGRNSGELQKEELTHDRLVRLMVGRDITRGMSGKRVSMGEIGFRTVNFALRRGEIMGLAGLVGAGRTELVESIFGVRRMMGGEMWLDGEVIRIKSPRDAIQRGIYLVPEDRKRQGVITEMSVMENLTLPGLGAGAAQVEALQIKCASMHTLLSNLSGGNQQKVAIGKWLARKPKLMIFDEPTRGVDVGAKAEIYKIMRQLADEGAMILVVSSDMEEIISISDRLLVMHEGRICAELLPVDYSEERILFHAFGRTL